MKFEELVAFFKAHPSYIRAGISTLPLKLRSVLQSDVKKARAEARKQFKEEGQYYHNGKVGRTILITEPKKKVLLFDLETAPMRAYVWGRWHQDIHLENTISEGFIICWSAKWLFNDDIMSDCLTPEEILLEDDSRIVSTLWELFDEADIIIAHNGAKFDIPLATGRFVIHGLMPPSPYFSVDTLQTAKRVFRFSSNKLDALAGYFGIPCKLDTSFDLWKQCMEGSQDALDYMVDYNKHDVDMLESVYLILRPYIRNHPNIANLLETDCCGKCGCDNLELIPDKFYYTQVSRFPLFRCQNCGAIVRGRVTQGEKVNFINFSR